MAHKPNEIPKPVFNALMKFSKDKKIDRLALIKELKWDGMDGNYFFWRSGMYHGVELDGHIHT